jgi:hypothetical protein
VTPESVSLGSVEGYQDDIAHTEKTVDSCDNLKLGLLHRSTFDQECCSVGIGDEVGALDCSGKTDFNVFTFQEDETVQK